MRWYYRRMCVGALDRFLHRSPHYASLGVKGGSRLHELIDPKGLHFVPFDERPHNFPAELSDDLLKTLRGFALGPDDARPKYKPIVATPAVSGGPLTAVELADALNGEWATPPTDGWTWSGVKLGTMGGAGDICFVRNKEQWGFNQPNDETSIQRAMDRNVSAVIVRRTVETPAELPALRVADTREALNQMAQANLCRSQAVRILVAGAKYRSSLSGLIGHLASRQVSVHNPRSRDAAGLFMLRSLAAIQPDHNLALIEASMKPSYPGLERARIVRPHHIVISDIATVGDMAAYSKLLWGGRRQLLHDIAESVVGMAENGNFIVPGDDPDFAELKQFVQQFRPASVLTFGCKQICDGHIVKSSWDKENRKWLIQAQIMGRPCEYESALDNSYTPQMSVAALLMLECLGLNLNRAVASMREFDEASMMGTTDAFEDNLENRALSG